jgi:hypothetical protein
MRGRRCYLARDAFRTIEEWHERGEAVVIRPRTPVERRSRVADAGSRVTTGRRR